MELSIAILLIAFSLLVPILAIFICSAYCCSSSTDALDIDIELGEVRVLDKPLPESCVRKHLLPTCSSDEEAEQFTKTQRHGESTIIVNHVFQASASDFEVKLLVMYAMNVLSH